MSNECTYRLETKRDYDEMERLTRDAFWDVYRPGCDEHYLLHTMRDAACYIPELSFLSVTPEGELAPEGELEPEGELAGGIYCTETIIRDGTTDHVVVCIGPIAVLPAYQRRGIGQKLLDLACKRAGELGYPCAVLFGNPGYYHRAGFTDAKNFGIHLGDGSDLDAFMCRPIDREKLTGVRGNYQEDPVFSIDQTAMEKFDKRFPPREKHVLPTQIFK